MKILKEIQERFSPYTFKNEEISSSDFETLITAAGMAASAFNEQPWRFVYASKNDEGFNNLVKDLVEPNQKWAKTAAYLLITIVKKTFTYNGNENTHNFYDLGLAMGNLSVQATSMGISVHHMSGLDRIAAAKTLNVPEDYEVVTAVAIGYHDGEKTFKERKSFNEIAFKNKWH